ncbi:hypothetical protein M2171_007361 [Bradyrhizobium japonicum USDA 38]|uniref:hypothetical protein n=1 Tax=Bradyrhizobium TaxID=374 RepID=UPI00126A0226|nr:hypothetical protein [Bradyrhizobium japonicum]MCS3898228.1 hypothetical protein [Bradyrhizobium japonicum USDA 38]MCS3941281.1 hypothetical protein [Bradyrhizobium japonicum]MCW2216663.1 hypothetical protein [Bradyrhizobium japonicum]MCW2341279.1 hypothetical protein [Bradyrhizobium japonicum]WLB51886.1 hypothetical protein QIH94_31625 [Bradyrhizobium japonicum]
MIKTPVVFVVRAAAGFRSRTLIGAIGSVPNFSKAQPSMSFGANRQRTAEKHVIKHGNGRNAYGYQSKKRM